MTRCPFCRGEGHVHDNEAPDWVVECPDCGGTGTWGGYRFVTIHTSRDPVVVATVDVHGSIGGVQHSLQVDAAGEVIQSHIFYMTPWEWGFLGD